LLEDHGAFWAPTVNLIPIRRGIEMSDFFLDWASVLIFVVDIEHGRIIQTEIMRLAAGIAILSGHGWVVESAVYIGKLSGRLLSERDLIDGGDVIGGLRLTMKSGAEYDLKLKSSK
jgi:hypothetical protein